MFLNFYYSVAKLAKKTTATQPKVVNEVSGDYNSSSSTSQQTLRRDVGPLHKMCFCSHPPLSCCCFLSIHAAFFFPQESYEIITGTFSLEAEHYAEGLTSRRATLVNRGRGSKREAARASPTPFGLTDPALLRFHLAICILKSITASAESEES